MSLDPKVACLATAHADEAEAMFGPGAIPDPSDGDRQAKRRMIDACPSKIDRRPLPAQ